MSMHRFDYDRAVTSLAPDTSYTYTRAPDPQRDARITAAYVMETREPEPSGFYNIMRPARVTVHRRDGSVVGAVEGTLLTVALIEAWKLAGKDFDQREAAREIVADGQLWGPELRVVGQ